MPNSLFGDNIGGSAAPRWLERAGFFGAAVLVLFFQVNATVGFIALCLTVLAFLLCLPRWMAVLARDPMAYLFLATAAYVAVSAALGASEFPETAPEQWKSLRLWSESLLFIPVAFFLGRGPLGLPRVFLLFAAGVLLRILTHIDAAQLFSGVRVGFGLNPIATALYSGLAALGLLTLAPRLSVAGGARRWTRVIVPVLGVAALLIFLEAMILSQSRGAWLAAALAFPATLLARYGRSVRTIPWRSSRTLGALALIVLAFGMFGLQNAEIIKQRVATKPEAVEQAVRGEHADDAEASIGYRLLLWRVGLDAWLERPVTGWGAGSTELLLRRAGVPMLMRADGTALFSHLHNTYLEILVRFGLFGAGLFGALGMLLVLAPWRGYRAGILSRDLLCLLLGAWAMTAVWAFFDFRFFHYEWRKFCVLLGAVSYSQALLLRRRELQR